MPLIIKSIEGRKNGRWWSCPQTETMVLTAIRYIHQTAPERMRNPEPPKRNFAVEQITEPLKG